MSLQTVSSLTVWTHFRSPCDSAVPSRPILPDLAQKKPISVLLDSPVRAERPAITTQWLGGYKSGTWRSHSAHAIAPVMNAPRGNYGQHEPPK